MGSINKYHIETEKGELGWFAAFANELATKPTGYGITEADAIVDLITEAGALNGSPRSCEKCGRCFETYENECADCDYPQMVKA